MIDLARENAPELKVLNLYEQFGFVFDHIYGYEMKYTDAVKVYNEQLPAKYHASFHWINVGTCMNMTPKLFLASVNSK